LSFVVADKIESLKGGEMEQPQGLFDEYGRRIPYTGMRVFPQAGGHSRRYYYLNQPAVMDYHAGYRLTKQYFKLEDIPFSAEDYQQELVGMSEGISHDGSLLNLFAGVHVPFIGPPQAPGVKRGAELRGFVDAAGRSFKNDYPKYDFHDLSGKFLESDIGLAGGSRYERLEEARSRGWIVGWYFPNCLSEYDLASQRKQMTTLPDYVQASGDRRAMIVLSGGVEAAAALIGCPGLLHNETNYPHHLCLAALTDPDENFFYSFEAYGHDLVFNRRTNMLTPSVTQISEQFAGGLTVFTAM